MCRVEASPEKAWKVKEVVHGALASFQKKAKTEISTLVARLSSEVQKKKKKREKKEREKEKRETKREKKEKKRKKEKQNKTKQL